MIKSRLLTVILILLFLCSGITSAVGGQTNESTKTLNDLQMLAGDTWNPNDEGDHFPCGFEMWFYHATLTLENGQKWDAAGGFFYFMNKTKGEYAEGLSLYRTRHWDRQTGRCYDNLQYSKFPGSFHTEKNNINLTYYNSSAQGLYPNYRFHFEDDKNNIITDLRLHAISSPHYLFQESTNGVLPLLFGGTGRAYFIPVLEAEGSIIVNGTTHNFTGVAYYEHDFIKNIDLSHPFAISSLKDFFIGTKLMFLFSKWRFSQVIQNKPKGLLSSLHRSSDYLFGEFWNWVVFDNGWSMVVFRPTISKISEGRVPATVYFTKDGYNYIEFGCVYWNNNKEVYMKQADIYLPVNFEITLYKDDIKLHVIFNASTEITYIFSEDFAPFVKEKGCSFMYCGTAKGYYTDKEINVSLEGNSLVETTRVLPKVGHRSLDIEVLLLPHGLGISIKRVSHRLGERFFKIQLKPTFELIYYIKPAPDT
jgi:hypothetical protein